MALDPYAPCPAGTGKKLKFCCADLINELDRIQVMLGGEQRLAALEYIEKLETRYPGRACLMTMRSQLLLELGRIDEARRVVDGVLAQAPLNPVGLAEASLLALEANDLPTAIEKLQQAIAASPMPMPQTVVESIAAMSEALVAVGQVPAALGHLLLLASLLPQDEQALGMIMRLNGSSQVPLLLKEEPDLTPSIGDVPWRARFDEAIAPLQRGAWRAAVDNLTALAADHPDAAPVWRVLGVLRSWLADSPGAVAALRRLAALDISLDERVEAEALAQLLDSAAVGDRVDMLRIVYPVLNLDALVERLSTDRVVTSPVDRTAWTERDEAPPRNSYFLLDRVPPRSAAGLSREDVPTILAQLLVFGRETNQEPRLQLFAARPNLPAAQAALDELCGPQIGAAEAEEVQGEIPATQWALSRNWRLPEEIGVDDLHELLVADRRHAVLQRWTTTPNPVLDGKTPQQASLDPKLRIRLLAAILVLETSLQESSNGDLFDELRKRLELPAARPVDLQETAVDDVPLARLHRVDWSQASDEQLLRGNRRALFAAAQVAVRKISHEIVGRESLRGKVNFAQVYGALSRLEDDSRKALENLDQARQAAEAANQSTAVWDLQELTLRLERAEPQEFARVLSHIQTHHAREPGVNQALVQILVEAGLMTPDGRPVQAPPEGASLVVPGAAEEPGKIWTPESEAGPGKKSALWVPGSE